MSNNPLISVIIPVYKVENYLDKCVESVVNQTYTNLEIILVDDGSPDNCPAMCDTWETRDARIRVIHKPNGGLSDARNCGIEQSNGEYLAFVDSDDWVTPDYIEKLYYALAENDADVSMCNFRKVDENDQPLPESLANKFSFGVYTGAEVLNRYFEYNSISTPLVIACGKLFKKELFGTLRFSVGKLCEDEFLFFPMYLRVNKAVMLAEELYQYLQRQGSIINSPISLKRIQDVCEIWESRLALLVPETAMFKKAAIGYSLAVFSFLDSDAVSKEPTLIRKLESVYKKNVRRYVLERCIDLPLVHKAAYLVVSISPRWFAGIVHRSRNA